MERTLARSVVLLALVAIISSAQCVNFCAVHPCDEVQPGSQTEQSCHHSKPSSTPEPQPRSNCAHEQMLVSEKVSFKAPGAIAFSILSLSFAHSSLAEVSFADLTAERPGAPPTQVLTKTVILRI
jgi:hypothetical protein